MLSLDSDRWNTLTHAYGTAADIPRLLRSAAADPSPTSSYKSEPWFSLWSALLHQGSVADAAYAAVPHLLRIAAESRHPYAWDCLALPAAVEAARLAGQAPQLPTDLAAPYLDAWATVPRIVELASARHWDHEFAQAATAALAAAKGHGALAEAISELGPAACSRFLKLVEAGEV